MLMNKNRVFDNTLLWDLHLQIFNIYCTLYISFLILSQLLASASINGLGWWQLLVYVLANVGQLGLVYLLFMSVGSFSPVNLGLVLFLWYWRH